MRPAAVGTPPTMLGSTNSLVAMPILESTHSIESTAPVSIAKRGMFPSRWVLGRVRCVPYEPLDALFAVQLVTVWVKTRCHLPSCTTTVVDPLGTLVRVKAPAMLVYAEAYAAGAVQPQTGFATSTPVVGVTTAPTG